jgi:ribosomal protein S18 acetylase RimI-like enzyme
MAGMVGDAARARALGEALHAHGVHPSPADEVWVAIASGRPVGVAVLAPPGAGARTGPGVGVVPIVLRAVPPWRLPRLAWGGWLRSRLDFAIPPDALHVVELHVTPELRGRGLGGRLLERAERRARELGAARMVLSTLATNPARRLYERRGYAVVAERSVRGYRALTGSPGRVFMEKPLADPKVPGGGPGTAGSPAARGRRDDPAAGGGG